MKKKIIGYTTGVFDLFHIGHLNILKQAKEHCDYLIVGVSTDENVQQYKHKTPVIPYEQRAAIVEAIKYVDKVVPQKNMDKLEAWNELHYDILFHGDDWKNSDMYNKVIEDLSKVDVKVVFLKHTQGISTTQIRNDAKK
ncbi:MAG: adenylyltransferase/cytidyltransferase family protein [archaeon]|nr:adenylyltransferase/cytidyltransferase family protein [Bacilli bacterium]MCQ2976388.1 adenylyltransferase/cytidyltransferase family protein [archaeon]